MEIYFCPICGAEILPPNVGKFRVEGGEDEAKPFSMLYEMTCPDCKAVINVKRDYDFDRGLIGCSFTW